MSSIETVEDLISVILDSEGLASDEDACRKIMVMAMMLIHDHPHNKKLHEDPEAWGITFAEFILDSVAILKARKL